MRASTVAVATAVATAVVVGLGLLARAAVGATPLAPPPRPLVVAPAFPVITPYPVVTGCRVEPRLFHSLKTGWVDYCRGHLGYVPGAFDCYNFTDQVCTVFLPATQRWTESRQESVPVVFPCPDAPEPPSCPRLGP